ncbi:MAG: histidinol-phosphate transaminase [Deltaproteobacteria bacterium]|nr:MAG: histidinol-phosphate transaminase [Deltaproteobacteria bacterium]
MGKGRFSGLVAPQILELSPYKPGKPIEELKRERGVERVVKLASNESPVGPSPAAVKALNEFAPKMNIYPDGFGYELKVAISEKWGVGIDSIVLGNGSSEIIEMCVRLFVKPGGSVVLANPSFSIYKLAAIAQGAKVIDVQLDGHGVDLGGILASIEADTSLVIIGNPNNPTGTSLVKSEWEDFLAAMPEGVVILLDEAYAEYAESREAVDGIEYIGGGKPVVVARTFSKAYGLAALRLGYGFAHPELVDYMNRLRLPFNANGAAQAAAKAALADEEHIARALRVNAEGRRKLYDFFDAEGIQYVPSDANFILALVGDGDALFEAMLDEGVIIRSAASFGAPGWVRVTIGLPEELDIFMDAFRKVYPRLKGGVE